MEIKVFNLVLDGYEMEIKVFDWVLDGYKMEIKVFDWALDEYISGVLGTRARPGTRAGARDPGP